MTDQLSHLDNKSPAELEARRRALSAEIISLGGANSLDVPITLLHELLFITRKLRQGNSGPPRAAKPATGGPRKPRGTADQTILDI